MMHDSLIKLAASFAGKHPEYGGDVAAWLSWCLPRGIDPIGPPALAIDYYQRDTSRGPAPIRRWLDWTRPRRRGTDAPVSPPGRGPRRRPATMLTPDQSQRLLRAAEQHRGDPAAVALFLLASSVTIRVQQICRLDVADLDTTTDRGDGLVVRVPDGPLLLLALVVADQINAHLAAYPRARESNVGGRHRVPLLRTGAGGRTTPTALGHGIRRIAATVDGDIGSLAPRITPGWLPAVDLHIWQPHR